MSLSSYCSAQGKPVRRGAIVPEQYRGAVRVALQRESTDQVHRSWIQRYRKRRLDTRSNRRWVELGITSSCIRIAYYRRYYFRKQSGSAYFGKHGIDVVVGSRVSAITA